MRGGYGVRVLRCTITLLQARVDLLIGGDLEAAKTSAALKEGAALAAARAAELESRIREMEESDAMKTEAIQ
eukprot:8885673-Pyramimonas_sp.AAC.1